jgi:hypothetical protein
MHDRQNSARSRLSRDLADDSYSLQQQLMCLDLCDDADCSEFRDRLHSPKQYPLPARGNHATIILDHTRLRRNLPQLRNQLLRAGRTVSRLSAYLGIGSRPQVAAFLNGIALIITVLLCNVTHRTRPESSHNLLLR